MSDIDTFKATCRVCHADRDFCRNINLYPTGSEGLTACQTCINHITTMVRGMSSVAFSARLDAQKRQMERQKP